MDLSFRFLKKTNFSSFLLNFEHNKQKKKLGCSGDVNLGDVSQLWTSLGLERHRLDDLLELVSIATTTPLSTKDEEGGQDLETEENVGESGDGKAETGGAKETRSYDPATIVDWNKLLALAAGQLGDVNTRLFFNFLFLIQSLYSYQSASNPSTHAEDSIKRLHIIVDHFKTCWQMARRRLLMTPHQFPYYYISRPISPLTHESARDGKQSNGQRSFHYSSSLNRE